MSLGQMQNLPVAFSITRKLDGMNLEHEIKLMCQL